MKLNSDNDILAESKALILYVLDKVSKPISNDALFKLILSIENMNYFYFQQFLLDLIDNRYIENNESIYALTSDGKQALELVKDLIPGIKKFKIDNNFKETLGNIENELSVTAEYIPHSETNYSVVCKIVENNQILFELQTFAGSRDNAKSIANNWQLHADKIYPEILNILTKNKSD